MLTAIVALLLLLGPLVVVHELGHYLVGRWFGVRADVFSVGFGKELIGWTDRRGTRWKLSALPLGGYVKFAGDMNAASMPDAAGAAAPEPYMFQAKPLWQRALIVAAGPLTNLLVAIAIFSAFNMIYGQVTALPDVAAIERGSPADKAGMRVGDHIAAIDGHEVDSFADIAMRVVPFPNEDIVVSVRRDGRTFDVPLRVAAIEEHDEVGNKGTIGRIGVRAGEPQLIRFGPVDAVVHGTDQTFDLMRMMVTGIVQLFTGERSMKELGGPLTIARVSGQHFSVGWLDFVGFAAFYSINLAFINLLPIPTLDGGHLAFYAAEAVRRKPLALRSQEWAFRTGLAFVVALMLIVTINDLSKLPIFGG